jgi:hypothetical protein
VARGPYEQSGNGNDHRPVAQSPFSSGEGAQESPNGKSEADNHSPHWYTAFEKADNLLVIAAFLTLGAIAWQAIEMRYATAEMSKSTEAIKTQADIMKIQTEATQDSVELQRVAMQQWVQVDGWRATYKMFNKSEIIMIVNFEVVNPTSFPLTISKVLTTFGELSSEKLDIFLVPKEGHSFTRSLNMTRFQQNQGMQRDVTVGLVVYVCYEDAFEKTKFQAFGKTCTFDMANGKAKFEPYRGILPAIHKNTEQDTYDYDEEPN